MFWLRIGSILDLTVIASGKHITEAAKFFDIPNSTLSAYIAGTRNIRESASWDMGTRWGKYIERFLSSLVFDLKEEEFEDTLAMYFNEIFDIEYSLRQLIEPIPWQNSFSCCAAQVLARFEANLPDSSKLDNFTTKDAFNLLKKLLAGSPFTREEHHEFLNLALRYVLWRVKTREYYKIEQFYPRLRCIEIRDKRPIPVLSKEACMSFVPDHRYYSEENLIYHNVRYPDVPRLKMAGTVDVLMLCRSVKVKIENNIHEKELRGLPIYWCSCVTPFNNEEICFETYPSGPPKKR